MGAAAIGRRVGVLTMLTGLLAVVAVASRRPLSSHAGASEAAGDLRGTLSALVVLVAVAAVVLLVVLASLFGGLLRRRSPDADLVARQPPLPAWKALPVLALVVAFALAAVVVIGALGRDQVHQSIVLPRTVRSTAGAPVVLHRPVGGSGLVLPTGAMVAGAALVLLLLASAVVVGLRSRGSRRSAVAARDGLLETEIDEAIADLVSGSSARRAVIGAYARMQRALAERALAHRASEAPREYLARARAALGAAGGSAGRLTDLFEEAKFSPHEIGEPMRREAIDALAAVRAELGGER